MTGEVPLERLRVAESRWPASARPSGTRSRRRATRSCAMNSSPRCTRPACASARDRLAAAIRCCSSAAASSPARCRCTSRRTRTASTCSTGPGPTPTSATAWTTTRSCSCAVPFTPVPGPRLLARDEPSAARRSLLRRSRQARDLSSLHVLFPAATKPRAARRGHAAAPHRAVPLDERGLCRLRRLPRAPERDKRKKIRQERRRVREAGVTFRWLRGARDRARATGTSSSAATRRTYRAHRSTPYLNLRILPAHRRDAAGAHGCCSSPSATGGRSQRR